ncbi:MAG: hypothetical protein HGA72_03155 [Chlorobiaceae bacterium]|nr:hypothetical protein [Chlorobiaceae bacterium]
MLLKQNLLQLFLARTPEVHFSSLRAILVIAPHPDDEILGLGGFLVRQIRSGKRVLIAYLTGGEKSLEDIAPAMVVDERHRLSVAVHVRLGLVPEQAFWCAFPDGALPRKGSAGFDGAVDRLVELIGAVEPDAVFVTHPLDTWPYDHVAAFEIASEALRRRSLPCDLYGYWVWLWYSMPLKRLLRLNWRNISRIPVHGELREKLVLTDMYLKPKAPNGKPWSGVLPKAMTDAFRYPYEVVEKF